MTRVLLSASHPRGDRAQSFRPYSHPDIDLAASAVIEAVLERPDVILRFGGHPSITPLVLDLASSYPGQQGGRIELVYSAFFTDQYTDEMRRLAATEGVIPAETPRKEDPDAASAMASSLTAMRRILTEPMIDGVFFIGGMDGLDEELTAVTSRHPRALLYCFAAPGGSAATLSTRANLESQGRLRNIGGRAYLLSSREAVAEITSNAEGKQ
jgi:hypothetical protein